MKNTSVETTWYPILDSIFSRLVAESEQSLSMTVEYGPGDVEQVQSLHDGLVNFVAVDVPASARVEVKK
jgi:hypothetical protein